VTEKRDTLDDMRDWRGQWIVPGVMVVPYRGSAGCGLRTDFEDFDSRKIMLERNKPGLVVSLIDIPKYRGICASIMALVMVPGGKQGWTAAFTLEVVQ
jgi:hypothetical protein